jgi:template-activating factor I
LTKIYPLHVDEDDGETLAEPGSFFNFFEVARDYHDVSVVWVPM